MYKDTRKILLSYLSRAGFEGSFFQTPFVALLNALE
jgi:hypothetical protein